LTYDPASQSFTGQDLLAQLAISVLEGRLPPHKTLFSYFPADRAMPTSEVNIQLGAADVNTQLNSYNSQPQTKFHRLKTTIVNTYLLNPVDPKGLLDDFAKIFSHLLKDRQIVGLQLNDFGLVSLKVRDLSNGQEFDLDSMSSGEKGLILMFLLIGQTLADGGILLIYEPELHLNPAVCKVLLPFLVEQYTQPQNLQAIICSHSPEILGAAFERPDCSLHHLQSEKVISPILPEDRKEVFDALRRLGTTASDMLFSSGSIFVEGYDDIEILETGFAKILNRYKVTQLEGRNNVEKEIRTLLAAEERGDVETLQCFIFDLDNAPTQLRSTSKVRVLQWDRRCIENYLINPTVIYEVLRDDEISGDKIDARGEVMRILREIAFTQLDREAALSVYKKYGFQTLGLPSQRDVTGKTLAETSRMLFGRISDVQNQIVHLQIDDWCADFEGRCDAEIAVLRASWDVEWIKLCDGKQFLKDLHSKFALRISPLKFKVRLMERLAHGRAEEWILLDKFLSDALKVTS
jgi:hypothetical protein